MHSLSESFQFCKEAIPKARCSMVWWILSELFSRRSCGFYELQEDHSCYFFFLNINIYIPSFIIIYCSRLLIYHPLNKSVIITSFSANYRSINKIYYYLTSHKSFKVINVMLMTKEGKSIWVS